MSDPKNILELRGEQALRAGRLLFDVLTGEPDEKRAVAKKVVVATVRAERRADLATVLDAEFEEEGTSK